MCFTVTFKVVVSGHREKSGENGSAQGENVVGEETREGDFPRVTRSELGFYNNPAFFLST